MITHTTEPWRFIEREVLEEDKSVYPRHILGTNDLQVCLLESPMLACMINEGKFQATNDIGLENAKRIVACVNACEGIPTYQLFIENDMPNKLGEIIDSLRNEIELLKRTNHAT